MKDGQNGGGSVNPLESEGNIYQHAAQSIEGNENRLPAKLGANLGTDDRATANSEGPEEEARFDGSHNGRRSDALDFRQIVESRGRHSSCRYGCRQIELLPQIGRAHVRTPVTHPNRMPP